MTAYKEQLSIPSWSDLNLQEWDTETNTYLPFNPSMVWFQRKLWILWIGSFCLSIPTWSDFNWTKGNRDNAQYTLSIPTWSDLNSYRINPDLPRNRLSIPTWSDLNMDKSCYEACSGSLSIPTWSDLNTDMATIQMQTVAFQSQRGLIWTSRMTMPKNIILIISIPSWSDLNRWLVLPWWNHKLPLSIP